MVDGIYSTSTTTAEHHFPPFPKSCDAEAERRDPERIALMDLFDEGGGTVCLNRALHAVEPHCRDFPYAAIIDAIDDGLVVAEFAAALDGSTLRSIVLRRSSYLALQR